MAVIGVVLFGTMALVTPFMQNLLGYPILTAGFLLGSRGIGTLIAMMLAPRLMRFIEARWLMLAGLFFTGVTLYQCRLLARHHAATIVVISIVQGFGLGLVFVPLSTAAFHSARSPAHRRHRDPDAGAQHRLVDRHLHGDCGSHQQDDRDARAP